MNKLKSVSRCAATVLVWCCTWLFFYQMCMLWKINCSHLFKFSTLLILKPVPCEWTISASVAGCHHVFPFRQWKLETVIYAEAWCACVMAASCSSPPPQSWIHTWCNLLEKKRIMEQNLIAPVLLSQQPANLQACVQRSRSQRACLGDPQLNTGT